jgi:hypothetical protein
MHVESYPPDVERDMKSLYESLNERDRRRYAAIEASKLAFGGRTYIVRLFGCDYKTIHRGLEELKSPPALPPGRIRKKGGPKSMLR